MGSNFNNYSSSVAYDPYSRPISEELNYSPNLAWVTTGYDIHTGKTTDVRLTNAAPTTIDDTSYGYDPSGNLTSETDERGNDTALTDTQCYAYDSLARLTQAWTATDACKANPSSNQGATVGDGIANAAYWSTWSFDPLGDRTGETDHALPDATGGDTTTSYTYPAPGSGVTQPHALTSTSTTGPAGTSSTAYAYDSDGNTKQRTLPAGTQNLTWTDTGKLATVTSTEGTTSYVYDADGNELLRRDPGATTLFLPNEQIVLNTATGAVTGTRFYALRAVAKPNAPAAALTTATNSPTSTAPPPSPWTTPPNKPPGGQRPPMALPAAPHPPPGPTKTAS